MKISRQQKILIIDEINYTRLGIDYALTTIGYKVTNARDNDEAMEFISRELPDVILISLRSSDSNGMTILRNLKEYFRLRFDIADDADPPVIVLSALRDTKHARELRYLGASMVLFKPINIQHLPDAIATAIANKSSSAPQERRKILVFDSETRSQKFIESILVHETYDFETSESEAETIARIKSRNYDLMIMDLASFESDFTETITNIRKIADETPIITIGGIDDRCSENDIRNLGINGHFIKPINVTQLQSLVDRLMESEIRETQDQLKGNDEVGLDSIKPSDGEDVFAGQNGRLL